MNGPVGWQDLNNLSYMCVACFCIDSCVNDGFAHTLLDKDDEHITTVSLKYKKIK